MRAVEHAHPRHRGRRYRPAGRRGGRDLLRRAGALAAVLLPRARLGEQQRAAHHHTKHGIAALVVALACFAFAWFQTGPKAGSAPSAT